MQLSIKQKIIGLALIAAILPVLSTAVLSFVQRSKTTETIQESVNTMIHEDLKHILKDFYSLCKTANDFTQQSVNHSLNVAREQLQHKGRVRLLDESIAWRAMNQFTRKHHSVHLPKLAAGRDWLGKNATFSKPSPVVDATRSLVGGTCTIFQRMNPQGDMLRVVTNVKRKDGSRAIGTYIPALNPDSTQNEVVATVLSGKTYRGRAYVVNDWYLTAYEPLRDQNSRIIGMLYVGVKQESAESFRKSILDTRVGKTGFLYALVGSGKHKGQLVISKNGARDGHNIRNELDARGHFYIRNMIRSAKHFPPGFIQSNTVHISDPESNAVRKTLNLFTYFEPWDWVIGARAYESDFATIRNQVTQSIRQHVIHSLLIGLIILIVMSFVAFIFGNKIANPMMEVSRASRALASGKLQEITVSTGKDETAALTESFNKMAHDLHLERQKLQETNQKLYEANVTKDKLYAIISHDLRNPFSTLRFLGELLYEDYDSLDEDERREYIQNIKQSSEHAFKLLEDLLQWSRLQRGKFSPQPEHLELSALVQETFNTLQPNARLKAIELHSELTSGTFVWADHNMVKTILRNLGDNAIKYTRQNGRVNIRAEKYDNKWRITVEDDGVGMKPEELKRLFRIDEAYSKRGTADEQGTGLGLLLCKEFVELSGGQIKAESAPDKGTRIIFTLPQDKTTA